MVKTAIGKLVLGLIIPAAFVAFFFMGVWEIGMLIFLVFGAGWVWERASNQRALRRRLRERSET